MPENYTHEERVYHYIRINQNAEPIQALTEAARNGDMHPDRMRRLFNQASMTGSIGDFAKEMLLESMM